MRWLGGGDGGTGADMYWTEGQRLLCGIGRRGLRQYAIEWMMDKMGSLADVSRTERERPVSETGSGRIVREAWSDKIQDKDD